MPHKALVVDANILIRGILGLQVRRMVEAHADNVWLIVPDLAFREAEKHLPALFMKRGDGPQEALTSLRDLTTLAKMAGEDLYGEFETAAFRRIGGRDPDDWPVLATALALGCPIWTEDTDFFGCGVATWKSATVEIFLSQPV